MEPEQNKKDTFLNQLLSMPQDKWDKDRERRALNKDANQNKKDTPLQNMIGPGGREFADARGKVKEAYDEGGFSSALGIGLRETPGVLAATVRDIFTPEPLRRGLGNLIGEIGEVGKAAITGEAVSTPVEGDTGVMHGPRNYPTPFLQNPAISTKEQVTDDAKFPKAPMISAPYQELPKGSSGRSDQEAKPLRELFTKENSDMGWQARLALNKQLLANEGGTKVQNSRAETDIETEGMRIQGLKDIENINQNKARDKNAQVMKTRESENLKKQHDLLSAQLDNPLLSANLSPDELSRLQKQREDIGKLYQSSLQTPGQLANKKAINDKTQRLLEN